MHLLRPKLRGNNKVQQRASPTDEGIYIYMLVKSKYLDTSAMCMCKALSTGCGVLAAASILEKAIEIKTDYGKSIFMPLLM